MEEAKKKLKVYCETSFWSWLVSRPSTDPDHAIKQAWTRKWWEEALLSASALPKDEVTEAYHIATAAIRGMDVLLNGTVAIWQTALPCRKRLQS